MTSSSPAGPDPDGRADRRPVVVGYNAKQHGRDALRWAVEEAVRRDVLLIVIYAANVPGMTLGPGPGLLEPEPGALDAAHEVTARGIDEALAAHPGVRVSGATEVTSPSQALTAASRDAGLLVIGTRGRGRLLGALLGSVAFSVVAAAECPVIVVEGKLANRSTGPGRRVLVGTDGSDHAAAAVRFAAERAMTTSAALEIVVCTGEPPVAETDGRTLLASARSLAATTAELVARTHPQLVVASRVEDGVAERALIDLSADAGLVVVGTRGRGAFTGLMLGSVSHAVIHGARCPVAVVPDR